MTSYDLIKIFEDTQMRIQKDPVLQARMQKSRRDSQLYLEGYVSPVRKVKGPGTVDVVETTTFQCARNLLPYSARIAVLNFANPHEPGGGVLRGAMAQEECLCRCSDLYNVLAQPYFLKHYYRYHLHHCDYFFSDRLIYSPDVTVFKSEDSIPQVLKMPFFVDVITCAAPYLDGSVIRTDRELLDIYRSRIRNILEVAIAKDVDCLVLGAFGCGAFHNNPILMANAFSDLLIRNQYAKYFKHVIFAIKGGRAPQNLMVFQKAFYGSSTQGDHPKIRV